jgi:hypothetical protein
MIFHLVHGEARRRALEAVAQAPAGYRVRVDEPKRTLDQNARLHAELQGIAETVEWAGKKRDVETWKRLLTAAWLRARGEPIELLPAIDGAGVDVVFRATSMLSAHEMSELIDYIGSWRASR